MNTVEIITNETIGTINPNIYGHFAEHIGGVIYDGIWVGRDSPVENVRGFRKAIVDDLRRLGAPVIRWPGGCFAETYDWRDGIGPVDRRPTTVNWWYGADGRLESNAVGTHEFADFCRMVGAEPYFAANATSTSPLEIRNWIEYCTFPSESTSLAGLRAQHGDTEPFDVTYWGIGNENWGGGGNMTPEDYAGIFRRYTTVASNAGGRDRQYIACGPSGNDLDWTIRFFEKMRDRIEDLPAFFQGFAAHYYCGTAGSALQFDTDQWYQLLAKAALMERLVVQQRSAMDVHDPERAIGLIIDEWGCWHPDGSGPSRGGNLFEQQSTMRDAIVAALTLNIFNNHCDKVVMTNIAQLVNNLHSLFLAAGDRCLRTPNYDVYHMFKGHQGAAAVRTLCDAEEIEYTDENGNSAEVPSLSCSASLRGRALTITFANLRYGDSAQVRLGLHGGAAFGDSAKMAVLQAADPHDHNTFEAPDRVRAVWSEVPESPRSPIELPPASVVMVEVPVQ